ELHARHEGPAAALAKASRKDRIMQGLLTAGLKTMGRSAGLVALTALFAAPALAQSAFSEAQKKEVKALVREYILQNPEIITEAVTLLQEKEEKAKAGRVTAAI